MPRITPLQVAMGVGTAGAMVDVSTYADLQEGVSRSWGRRTEYEDVPPGEFSFVLDNADGRFTPGNTNSPLTTTVTEGMMVSWILDDRLCAGTIQAIEPTFPGDESAWAQIRITCDDMLGNAGRRSLESMIESITNGATPYLLWRLDDATGTTVPVESSGYTSLLTLTGSNGSAFEATPITGLTGDQLTLKDSLTGSGWPTFGFTYTDDTLGFYSYWITPVTGSKITCAVSISGLVRSFQFGYNGSAFFVRDGDSGTSDTYTFAADSAAHYISMGLTSVFSAGNWTITATLYVDGTAQANIDYGSSVSSLDYRAPVGLSLIALV